MILRTFLMFLALMGVTYADEAEILGPIEVTNTAPENEPVNIQKISPNRITGDSASLLDMTPGISLQGGGGLSSLPVIQGMADDRVNIKIDGANSTSSCPNHMNPAMSYIDPTKISTIDVLAGITPVSYGGDSIGGSIVVRSKELVFAGPTENVKQNLNLRSYFKSNNENQGASLSYSVALKKVYLGYSALDESANNYRNGRGERIKSTLYNQNNQSFTIGRKFDDGVLSLKLTHTIVPYEGFVNQRMDMKDNVSNLANLTYTGVVGEAIVDSSIYYQHTNHFMDIISSERSGSMPMYTRSDEAGYNLKANFELNTRNSLTVGSDFNRYRLNDWWPGLPDVTMIMGPGAFESIHHGKRDRLGFFAETDSRWTDSFSTNFGLRTDIVSMDTQDVKGYNNTDNLPADANAFNAKSHSKRDHNYDTTLTSKLKLSPHADVELGLGRKTRSPNLYERYAWAGSVTDPTGMTMDSMSAAMDMMMINWFRDGNGYVGDINLKPEVAHKVSASFITHDEVSKKWEIRLTPYYSEVTNFIDADFLGSNVGTNFLKFANHDATVFGADLSTKARVIHHKGFGDLNVKVVGGYTRGYRKDGKAELYHIMPLNGKVAIQHSVGKWSTDLVTHLVNRKKQVNEMRQEPVTAGYALLDLGTSFQVTKLIKIDLGVNNILDHQYGLPLGGIDLVNHSADTYTPVAGIGRSINAAVSVDFF